MNREIRLTVSPEVAANKNLLDEAVRKKAGQAQHYLVLKKSIDARKKPVKIHLVIELTEGPETWKDRINAPEYRDVAKASSVIIVGAALGAVRDGL